MGSRGLTDTRQIGIVVPEVEATMRRYVDDYRAGARRLKDFRVAYRLTGRALGLFREFFGRSSNSRRA